jgi:hypothetical protein
VFGALPPLVFLRLTTWILGTFWQMQDGYGDIIFAYQVKSKAITLAVLVF